MSGQQTRLRAALVQMTATTRLAENARLCAAAIRQAASGGAQFVSLPEVANLAQLDREKAFSQACPEARDPCLAACRELAAELNIWVHVGSCVIRPEGADYLVNRAFVIDGGGEIRARYDKIHMFDVDLENGESYRESALFRAGNEAVLVRSPWGGLGLTICYDLRFPALHRALAAAGAEILLNPASFTRPTGRAHWRTLLTARAIETGSFVLAAAQCGTHEDGRQTWGHSLAVSPWGEVLAEAGEDPCVTLVDLDLNLAAAARRAIPALRAAQSFTLREA